MIRRGATTSLRAQRSPERPVLLQQNLFKSVQQCKLLTLLTILLELETPYFSYRGIMLQYHGYITFYLFVYFAVYEEKCPVCLEQCPLFMEQCQRCPEQCQLYPEPCQLCPEEYKLCPVQCLLCQKQGKLCPEQSRIVPVFFGKVPMISRKAPAMSGIAPTLSVTWSRVNSTFVFFSAFSTGILEQNPKNGQNFGQKCRKKPQQSKNQEFMNQLGSSNAVGLHANVKPTQVNQKPQKNEWSEKQGS